MYIPNEIVDVILLYSDSEDINNWKDYSRLSNVTFLKKSHSTLEEATEAGNLRCAKHLVSVGADIHADDDCALRWSAEFGHLEVVKYLVSVGADIHACNDWALMWSACNGHLEVVEFLTSIGADIHACDDWKLLSISKV